MAVSHQISPAHFRTVLGKYPTGVCAITAMGDAGPAAMIVGTFVSVSLDPPLVGFLPDCKSTSWPKIQATGRFCANILSEGDQDVCTCLAASGGNKFERVGFRLSERGSPILECALAWVDCTIASVSEAGDHLFVTGAVDALEIEQESEPLLFFGGRLGRFTCDTVDT